MQQLLKLLNTWDKKNILDISEIMLSYSFIFKIKGIGLYSNLKQRNYFMKLK